jgi:hypothetical protein
MSEARKPDSPAHRIAFIAGMPRAGTTFLYHHLQRHPQIYVPFRRKTNYFSLHSARPVEWFLDHFDGMGEHQVGIDTETLYFVDRTLPSLKGIRDFNADAKIMIFVRRPGEWALSLYRQIATFDRDMPSFGSFLTGGYTLVEDDIGIPFSMTDGDIEANIAAATEMFRGNVLIVNFELFERDPFRVLKEIEKFLGLDGYFRAENLDTRKINASDRAHVSILASLLRKRWFIDLLSRLPRQPVIFVRRLYDELGRALGSRRRDAMPAPADDIALARAFYKSDEKFVSRLFEKGDVIHA